MADRNAFFSTLNLFDDMNILFVTGKAKAVCLDSLLVVQRHELRECPGPTNRSHRKDIVFRKCMTTTTPLNLRQLRKA
jgi:hypothetical protein